jgi:hypothetical protein
VTASAGTVHGQTKGFGDDFNLSYLPVNGVVFDCLQYFLRFAYAMNGTALNFN